MDSQRRHLFRRSSHQFRAPIEGGRFHAIPLRDEDDTPAHGLLLASTTSPRASSGGCLAGAHARASRCSRLLSRHTLAETRFGQERMLLYSIINAVTDPILLTDTEGKLIIANTHAEKLFAAPEDASEGWRRAAGLNNMLFSAALSTSAVGQTELARRELLLVDPLEGSDLLFELLSSRATDERQGTYVVSILRNVTDLARAKEEIEESYRTLRARAGGSARRAPSARSDHRLGRRPDSGHRPGRGHRADERAGRAAVHGGRRRRATPSCGTSAPTART